MARRRRVGEHGVVGQGMAPLTEARVQPSMFQNESTAPPPDHVDAARETVEGAAEVGRQLIKETDWSAFLGDWRFQALAALVGLLVLAWGYRRVRRMVRRARGPKIHPLLQKYSGQPDPKEEKLAVARRKEAEKIIATSSSEAIVGYQIVEQIEAVYVDGFRRPEEAIEGLKAAAAMRGANAVVNVHQERNSAGRCAAHGDAVVVLRPGAMVDRAPRPPCAESDGRPDAGSEGPAVDRPDRGYVADDGAITPSTGDEADA
ncbi:MAG: hypothetical protein C4547_09765 [Phycisphaerales bacterium]|nr:MAG: hypothetical protein C4547_09765 [Phycisphaerales bacterium]